MRFPALILGACSWVFASTAQSAETYLDDFSQPNGAPQGLFVFHGSVSVKDRALSLLAVPNGSFDCPGNPTAYVGSADAARRFEAVGLISAMVTFPGNPTSPDTGDIGGLLFCAQDATDNCKVKGYAISYIRGRFYLDIRGPEANQSLVFSPVGSTYEGRWTIELSDTKISFSVNDVHQFTVADATYRSGLVGFWSYFYDNRQNMMVDDLEIVHGTPACTARLQPDFPYHRPWYPPNSLAVNIPFGANDGQDYQAVLTSSAPEVARPAGSGPEGSLTLRFAAGEPSRKVVPLEVSGTPGLARFELLEPSPGCPPASTAVEVLSRRLISFQDSFPEGNGPPAHWTINRGGWSVQSGKLVLGPGCNDPGSPEPTISAGSPPIPFQGVRVISTSLRLANSTGSREGRTGGIVFCSRDPVGAGFDRSGYSITWIDRAEDRGYWFIRNHPNGGTMIAGPTFAQFPLGTRWQVIFDGPRIRFRVDGNLVFEVADSTYRDGYFGYWAYCNGTTLEVDDVELGDPYATGKILRVQPGATGAGDGSSWADAYPQLSLAVNASDEGDELWVAGGTYTAGTDRSSSFLLKDGVGLYGGFAGTEAKRELRDPSQHRTVLSGDLAGDDEASAPPGDPRRRDSENSFHLVTLGNGTVMDGFEVTGGYAGGEEADGTGAGILVSGSGASVSNVEILQNFARRGSGIHLLPTGGAQLTNVLLAENLSLEGGTVYCERGSALTLLNSTLASNLAAAGSPGLRVEAASTLVVTNSIAWNGGGGEALSMEEGASPAITYSLIEGDQVPAGEGNLNRDPLFRRPAHRDDGGTPGDPTDDRWATGSYQLLEASPAIDSAGPTGAPATDLRGISRPCDGAVDLGAYEYCEPPDFLVKLSDAGATLGERFGVRVELDFDHNPDTPAARVEGWSYGICHDPALLQPISVTWTGSNTAGLRDGQGPDFLGTRLPSDLPAGAKNGITVGVVLDTSPPFDSALPAVNGWRDALITYAIVEGSVACSRSGDTATTRLSVCDTLDSPPIRVIMTVNSESLPAAAFDSATITLRCPTLFRRGDSTRDGFIDISDAICIFSGLFGVDAGSCVTRVPECLKAVDVNDDGTTDITDPIALLLALFGDPPPIPPLTGGCTFDRTADDLSCESYPPCQ